MEQDARRLRAVLWRIYELHTRTDPSRPVLHIMAEGSLRGKSTLVAKAIKEAPEVASGMCASTLLRESDAFARSKGCTRFSVHDPGHSACDDCNHHEADVNRETSLETALRHAKEDAAAAEVAAAGALAGAMSDDEGGGWGLDAQSAKLKEVLESGKEHIGLHYEVIVLCRFLSLSGLMTRLD